MARDYYKHNTEDTFEYTIAQNNPQYYKTGRTGYESYYIDIQGFWRDLYYPHLGDDIQIFNENEQYSASINVSDVELGGEFDEEYIIDFYTYLEAKDGTPITVAEIKDGKLYQVDDTTKMEADYVTFEGVLYQVRLWYVAPTATETVKLDIKDAEMIIDFDYGFQHDQLHFYCSVC